MELIDWFNTFSLFFRTSLNNPKQLIEAADISAIHYHDPQVKITNNFDISSTFLLMQPWKTEMCTHVSTQRLLTLASFCYWLPIIITVQNIFQWCTFSKGTFPSSEWDCHRNFQMQYFWCIYLSWLLSIDLERFIDFFPQMRDLRRMLPKGDGTGRTQSEIKYWQWLWFIIYDSVDDDNQCIYYVCMMKSMEPQEIG